MRPPGAAPAPPFSEPAPEVIALEVGYCPLANRLVDEAQRRLVVADAGGVFQLLKRRLFRCAVQSDQGGKRAIERSACRKAVEVAQQLVRPRPAYARDVCIARAAGDRPDWQAGWSSLASPRRIPVVSDRAVGSFSK